MAVTMGVMMPMLMLMTMGVLMPVCMVSVVVAVALSRAGGMIVIVHGVIHSWLIIRAAAQAAP